MGNLILQWWQSGEAKVGLVLELTRAVRAKQPQAMNQELRCALGAADVQLMKELTAQPEIKYATTVASKVTSELSLANVGRVGTTPAASEETADTNENFFLGMIGGDSDKENPRAVVVTL